MNNDNPATAGAALTRADTLGSIIDAVAVQLPKIPRSTIDQVVRACESLRSGSEPALVDAPMAEALQLIARTGLAIQTSGGPQGSLNRIGEQAAVAIINRLHEAGMRLMTAPDAPG